MPRITFAFAFLTLVISQTVFAQTPAERATEIFNATRVQGGFVVHLGCGDGELTAALKKNDSFQVHGLDSSQAEIAKARKSLLAQGLYGDVAVDQLIGTELPYVDNMVNLLVISKTFGVPNPELIRVLAPRGVLYYADDKEWITYTKPVPPEIDEWTHYLHSASGNAVAHDSIAGPPRHLQWLGSPRWSRHHDRMASMSGMVTTGGRLFYIMDEGSRVSIQMPPKWTLVARDAFNGVILWKRPLKDWQNHLWPLKSGPTALARRLVAVDDRVYVTMGFEAPLSELDAATGELIQTYENTTTTEEAILQDGMLLLLVNKAPLRLSEFAPKHNTGDQARIRKEFAWIETPREIVAINAATGEEAWRHETVVAPLSLCANKEKACFHDGEKVVCLDLKTGVKRWQTPPASRRPSLTFNFGPKLLVHNDVVLFAGGDRTMRAYDVDSGKKLWEAPHAQSGYQSPEDLLVAGGLVWNAATTRTKDDGVFVGRDPKTGEVKKEFPPDVETYWFHHRCYIAKATDRFLLPSRTGIEFVDFEKKHWDIHHWVRGGCLYGVMPANGMVYAPPHNCACYPEAKLFGMNALAPASAGRKAATELAETPRLIKGVAFGEELTNKAAAGDWPTYRGDAKRSGRTETKVAAELRPQWELSLGGRLSSIVIAGGNVFVSQIDQHTVHAINEKSGKLTWSYTTGGRVDSPPTVIDGRVHFGSADGWAYCLRATDGELIWKFRAAPRDRRLLSLEQLESVWPVHGSVLVQDGAAYVVAGRSNFLDGGLRFLKLDAATGEVLAEKMIDQNHPETGDSLQDRIAILNMPAGLPDILSSDGESIYMRSQQFNGDGDRIAIGPHSGSPAEQGKVQKGAEAHIFSPTGFIDGDWFHRSYFVYGRSFAGGHSGYHQAGKFAPAGRIMTTDDENVYSFGRKPEYFRWTTTMEHQLFSSPKEFPDVAPGNQKAGGMVHFAMTKSIDPTGKPLVVSAWVRSDRNDGVVIARGGPQDGFALLLVGGKPQFDLRANTALVSVTGAEKVVGRWVQLTGVVTADKDVQLYVDGKKVASAKTKAFIATDPKQSMQIGGDELSGVGNYQAPYIFTGLIDEVQLRFGTATEAEIAALAADPAATFKDAKLVMSCDFNKGDASDSSGRKNNGTLTTVSIAKGKFGKAAQFVGKSPAATASKVPKNWEADVPLYARAMTLANKTIFVAGPPDVMNEEETFARLTQRDPEVHKVLAEQNAALEGKRGAVLMAVSAEDGKTLSEISLESPPVWDGMAAAKGKLFMSSTDGKVRCYGPSR